MYFWLFIGISRKVLLIYQRINLCYQVKVLGYFRLQRTLQSCHNTIKIRSEVLRNLVMRNFGYESSSLKDSSDNTTTAIGLFLSRRSRNSFSRIVD